MMLTKLNYPDVLYVAENMREWDKREIYAGRFTDDPHDLAESICLTGGISYVVKTDDNEPVVVFGVVPISPTFWNVYMFCTDRFGEVAVELGKYIKRIVIPGVLSTGALRAECRSMEGHTDAHRWLKFLGFRFEGENLMLGKHGETFYLFAFTQTGLQTD